MSTKPLALTKSQSSLKFSLFTFSLQAIIPLRSVLPGPREGGGQTRGPALHLQQLLGGRRVPGGRHGEVQQLLRLHRKSLSTLRAFIARPSLGEAPVRETGAGGPQPVRP